MVTMRDVARVAQVSQPVVSAVLNNKFDNIRISEEKCRLVRETVKRLGYRRNEAAQIMAKGKTRTIACMVKSLKREYHAATVEGIVREINKSNYFVKIFTWENSKEFEAQLNNVLESQPRGFLFRGITENLVGTIRSELGSGEIPSVCLDSSDFCKGICHLVRNDERQIFELLVDHLISLGHRDIGFVVSGATHEYIRELRRKMYVDVMKSRNLPVSIYISNPEMERFRDSEGVDYEPLGEFCDKDGFCTALVAASEGLAVRLVNQFQDLGMNVPGDISIAGIGNLSIGRAVNPMLTSVEQHFEKIGAESVRVLFKAIEDADNGNPQSLTETLIDTDLLIRGTTGPLNQKK